MVLVAPGGFVAVDGQVVAYGASDLAWLSASCGDCNEQYEYEQQIGNTIAYGALGIYTMPIRQAAIQQPQSAGAAATPKELLSGYPKASGQTGSYTDTFASGKQYHGKGSIERAQASAKRVTKENNDPAVDVDWARSSTRREAFKDEAQRIDKAGGVSNPNNYNKINSPGKKYLEEDDE